MDKRGAPRKRTLKAGKIVYGEKDAVTIDCIVRNLSDKGARLQVPLSVMIPANFRLAVGGVVRSVAVAWRKGDLMGVRFDRS
jgi:hypothetical protein